MNDYARALLSWLIRGILAFAICCVYAGIKTLFVGEDWDASDIESIILLVGSILLANAIVDRFPRLR